MEIHQLRYVVAVARTGSFSRAAEDCHVSQPSLSQQIGKLENELGERLFERDRRRTRLTPAGERFVARAARILEDIAEARREAEETHTLLRGTVTIGVLPTIAPYLLPPIIEEFTRRHPSLQFALHEETTAALEALMTRHEIDFAIASLPLRNDLFEITPLFSEELLLALPAEHPLATRRKLDASDLESEAFLLMKEEHCLGDQTLQFCQQKGLRPRIVSRSTQIETIRRLVGAGLGLSLIPRMAVPSPPSGSLVFRSPCRQAAAHHHGLPPPAPPIDPRRPGFLRSPPGKNHRCKVDLTMHHLVFYFVSYETPLDRKQPHPGDADAPDPGGHSWPDPTLC